MFKNILRTFEAEVLKNFLIFLNVLKRTFNLGQKFDVLIKKKQKKRVYANVRSASLSFRCDSPVNSVVIDHDQIISKPFSD